MTSLVPPLNVIPTRQGAFVSLVAAGQARVIITTGYRDDYLSALKALSNRKAAHPFVLMMDRAQAFVSELPLAEYEETETMLEATGALDESGDRRLRLPSELG